ncbi:hypothetical protein [Roseofilum capinflatum]|uniref:Uncharacterized protein n=1 Tax=Roseofilum capinflatum BLCC-M114 TaxID=3022440 RepID=A0ABT7B336_9CYAN|nr:hypothetical protein [Roseofilum capinflatum]MDJ1173227.1 hypothetical protein [Roseofilum capinflatum BLCC-M114]
MLYVNLRIDIYSVFLAVDLNLPFYLGDRYPEFDQKIRRIWQVFTKELG